MGRRHDVNRKCALVRDLLQENRFTEALEVIDEIPLKDVGSIEDLYLFAELYEKAERMNKKKEIFYLIYDRTKSRHVLNRLLRLVLRMGDMSEARELFLVYEFGNDVTLETFELRYLIARAEGESRSSLISILEELKREEYTEEWGYQLARLYEQEGMRKECIQECKDLELWFGQGRIVDKAKELRARCEAPGWQPPREEEIPEPEEPEREEIITYASHPVHVTALEDTAAEEQEEEKPAEREIPAERKKPAEKKILVEREKPAEKKILVERESPAERKIPVEREIPAEGEIPAGADFEESVSEPVPVKREPAPGQRGLRPVENLDDLLQEEEEDISDRGIRYYTLKSAINLLRRTKQEPHFVFAGGEERITLAVAKRITKELNNVGHFSARSIVKIAAGKLNELKLSEQKEKLSGGCMLVTNASEMSNVMALDLLDLMDELGEKIVVMLSGPFDEMDCFLADHKELSEKLFYKVRM